MFRVPIEDELLREDAETMIPIFFHLANKGLLQICTAQFWLQQSLFAVEICRMVIQAVPSAWKHTESSELFQLPYFNAEKIKNLKYRKRAIKTIPQLMQIPAAERKTVLEDDGFNQEEIQNITVVGETVPHVTIEDAFFHCVGEPVITPGSLVTFVLVLRAVHFGETGQPVSKITEDKENMAPVPKSPKVCHWRRSSFVLTKILLVTKKPQVAGNQWIRFR